MYIKIGEKFSIINVWELIQVTIIANTGKGAKLFGQTRGSVRQYIMSPGTCSTFGAELIALIFAEARGLR